MIGCSIHTDEDGNLTAEQDEFRKGIPDCLTRHGDFRNIAEDLHQALDLVSVVSDDMSGVWPGGLPRSFESRMTAFTGIVDSLVSDIYEEYRDSRCLLDDYGRWLALKGKVAEDRMFESDATGPWPEATLGHCEVPSDIVRWAVMGVDRMAFEICDEAQRMFASLSYLERSAARLESAKNLMLDVKVALLCSHRDGRFEAVIEKAARIQAIIEDLDAGMAVLGCTILEARQALAYRIRREAADKMGDNRRGWDYVLNRMKMKERDSRPNPDANIGTMMIPVIPADDTPADTEVDEDERLGQGARRRDARVLPEARRRLGGHARQHLRRGPRPPGLDPVRVHR